MRGGALLQIEPPRGRLDARRHLHGSTPPDGSAIVAACRSRSRRFSLLWQAEALTRFDVQFFEPRFQLTLNPFPFVPGTLHVE